MDVGQLVRVSVLDVDHWMYLRKEGLRNDFGIEGIRQFPPGSHDHVLGGAGGLVGRRRGAALTGTSATCPCSGATGHAILLLAGCVAGKRDHRSVRDCVDQNQKAKGDRAREALCNQHDAFQGKNEAEGLALVPEGCLPELVDGAATKGGAAQGNHTHCQRKVVVSSRPRCRDLGMCERSPERGDEPADHGTDRRRMGVACRDLELGHDVHRGGAVGGGAVGGGAARLAGSAHGIG